MVDWTSEHTRSHGRSQSFKCDKMPNCFVKKCKNRTERDKNFHGISYHSIPREPHKKEKWIKALQALGNDSSWFPSNHAVVCSDHFRKDDFTTTKNGLRTILKTQALPIYKNRCIDKDVGRRNYADTSVKIPPSIVNCAAEMLKDFTEPMDVCEDHVESTATVNLVPQIIEPMELSNDDKALTSTIEDSLQPIIEDDIEIIEVTETPRKSKLRKRLSFKSDLAARRLKIIKCIQGKYRRLRSKYQNLHELVEKLKKERYINEEQRSVLAKNTEGADIITALQKRSENKKRAFRKYPQSIRKFAVTLHFYSPSAYKYARQMLNGCLPHPSTIGKWYQHINGEPGFTAESFEVLKIKTSKSNHKFFVLDEMAVRQQVIFEGDKYEGYVDLGHGVEDDCQQIATSALVFMLVCINDHWKMPIGYFLVNGINAEQKTTLIKMSLEKCAEAGVDVVLMTFDGCPTHLSVMRLLGCEIEDLDNVKTDFPHPKTGKPVVVLLDPCHMLKLVRNCLEAKKEIHDKNNDVIKWKYLVELNRLQNSQGLCFANKLKTRHIMFRNQIMKVKLAAQLLSRSVAKALTVCKKDLNLPEFQGSSATSDFLQIFNDIFDILNTKSRLGEYGFKHAVYAGNKDEIFSFIEHAIEYIKALKIRIIEKKTIKRKNRLPIIRITRKWVHLVKSKSKTGFIGMIVCLESLKRLYTELIENQQLLKYIPTYKLSQDHLELFFGNVRSQGGHNNNPNARQFKTAFKKLLNHLELRSGFSGNTIPREQITILNCSSAITRINVTSSGYRHDTEEEENLSANEDPLPLDIAAVMMSEQLPEGTQLIVGYIAGFTVRSIIKKVKCEACIASLLAFETEWFHKLIVVRDMEGLCYPSKIVYQICLMTEKTIKNLMKESRTLLPKFTKTLVYMKVLQSLVDKNIEVFFHDDKNHSLLMIRAIVEKYTTIKLHHETVLLNIGNKTTTTRQLYNNLTQFKGL